ncbi:MAG: DNA mismatch repair endonuclease MutL, partial [Dehalococcoidia bacterium]|nr:DNA mismatch repair endonuclease MutL [Dehalococcoidia bacterium]
ENALDAGASQITVEVKGGGVDVIRVLDNGHGIPPQEVEMAFQRYATSKISSTEDLDGITTLGFRGEALPAMAAVAEVEILTRHLREKVGTYISLQDGQTLQRRSRARPPGTTITVRYLFRGFPARLKFLKSRPTENGHTSAVVSHYALAFPGVKFNLYLEGRQALRTSGDADLRQASLEVYNLEVSEALLEVEGKNVTGLISPPSLTRSNRSHQSFFVNRRWVRNPMLSWALEDAYQGLLSSGRHPMAVLHLDIPPEDLDVNIHPAKAEVKFRDQRIVTAAIQDAVCKALDHMPVPRMEARPSWMNRGMGQGVPAGGRQPALFTAHTSPAAGPAMTQVSSTSPSVLRPVGQVCNNYIVAEGPDGLYLMDQHTVHERILYERLMAQRDKQTVEVQGLLEPMVLEMDRRQQSALEYGGEALSGYGFTVEPFGEGNLLVRAVPAMLQGTGVKQALEEVLGSLDRGGEAEWPRRIATSLACHGAVRAGQSLSLDEMRELLRGLEDCNQPYICPHGRPVMLHFSSSNIDKQFGRR